MDIFSSIFLVHLYLLWVVWCPLPTFILEFSCFCNHFLEALYVVKMLDCNPDSHWWFSPLLGCFYFHYMFFIIFFLSYNFLNLIFSSHQVCLPFPWDFWHDRVPFTTSDQIFNYFFFLACTVRFLCLCVFVFVCVYTPVYAFVCMCHWVSTTGI